MENNMGGDMQQQKETRHAIFTSSKNSFDFYTFPNNWEDFSITVKYRLRLLNLSSVLFYQ